MGFKVTFNNFDSAYNAYSMFNLRQQFMESIVEGKYKQARTQQKEFAKLALEDFDTYKKLPNIHIKNMPLGPWLFLLFRNLNYKIFRAFTRKTPEEKQLAKQMKSYIKTMTPEEKNAKTIDLSN